ncbi:hypothetical protein N7532_008485 [Penicillium argentinense]|uniref:Man1/Src1-like C-terminal domain-containing protein n=1 Tax=Penicillium argentinense TaxID=1131581 RepID=A0A9W9EXQ6_9EURO|nr:uncharacterized protein N7532_008485 [Penicillium argentinense]KAJ5089801.1 hypothetical protein N7532_008485 [Penicillium argentinense]
MADELDYLQSDFDLNSLTVPRLRSILLIRILEDEVLPQAKKLLRDRERVRRTSAGITDMSTSRSTSVASDRDQEDRDSLHPPPTPSTTGTRRGGSRRSARASTMENDDVHVPATPATATKRKSAVARSVGKHPRASDTETGDDKMATPVVAVSGSPRKSTTRKLRRSEVLPSTEVDAYTPSVTSVKTEPREDTVFTDDNPFQSGSPSDMGRSRTSSHDGKRKSGGRLSTESPAPRKSGLRARKSATPTNFKQDGGIKAPTRESFDFYSRLQPPQEETEEEDEAEEGEDEEEQYDDDSEVDAGEEFTPEEQLALETEQYAPITQVRKRKQKQGFTSLIASWLVILGVLGSFGAWWRKEKIEIGFCGLGKPTWSLAETRVPEWANVLEPRCEPCPPHAFCYPDFEARCEHDFILKPHPLSLGGLVPLPPTCEPDSEKARRVKAVADKAVEELRDRRAKYECGELKEDGTDASPDIPEPNLKEEVAKKRRKGLTDAEFDDLWKGAIGEIIDKDEVVSKTEQPSAIIILTSTSVARLPFTCATRRYVRLALLAYRLPLSLLALTIVGLAYARARVRARRKDIARVPDLVATSLDRLATQAALYARGGAMEPYIPIGQMRDDVLRSELHGKRREELWRRVQRVVEGNANVRAAVRESRSGDVARSWEWIGGIGGVGGNGEYEGIARRGSARFSLPSPSSGNLDPGHHMATEIDDPAISPPQARRWDEGRPIY